MVRLDHLNIYNGQVKETPLDVKLKELGGTLYTKCYTPAPDTPRSLACMQTGLLPYFNGCDTRIKWPRYFIKDDVQTLWDIAANKNYHVNLCARQHYIDTGMFRFDKHPNIKLYNTFDSFVKGANISGDTLSYVGTPDIHLAVDDLGGTEKALKEGFQKVAKMFEIHLTKEVVSNYDYVFVFSDHGLQMETERRKLRSKLDLLNDGRTRLLMFMHRKDDRGIKKDNRLASMTDLFSTVSNLMGVKQGEGYSLTEVPMRTITHIEDHVNFTVSPEVMIKQWRVITKDDDIRTNVYSTITEKGISVERSLVDGYLTKYSPQYEAYVKQLKIWELYAQLKNQDLESYFIGDKRVNKLQKYIRKTIRRFCAKILNYISWL